MLFISGFGILIAFVVGLSMAKQPPLTHRAIDLRKELDGVPSNFFIKRDMGKGARGTYWTPSNINGYAEQDKKNNYERIWIIKNIFSRLRKKFETIRSDKMEFLNSGLIIYGISVLKEKLGIEDKAKDKIIQDLKNDLSLAYHAHDKLKHEFEKQKSGDIEFAGKMIDKMNKFQPSFKKTTSGSYSK